ncbi:MAG: DUF3106 domain-containing protein [Limisphaerales bacterium]
MNGSHQARWWLIFCAAGQWIAYPLPAENSPNNSPNVSAPVKLFSTPKNLVPPLPQYHSPVDFFRKLLAMAPGEREHFLTNRPPEIRERILDKINEYEALNPDERELRLRATELRWYLTPLLRESPTNRDARLAQVPEDIRDLVKARLMQWEILPPPIQDEFLENERTLNYFTHVDSTNIPTADDGNHQELSGADQSRWNSLSENERKTIAAQFNQFFELTPMEKQETLNTLSDAERAEMEKTLQSFNKLPPTQRAECVQAFAKFAGMSAPERAEFLKNARRWSQMSPSERKAWRDLVAHVPEWPPLPMAFIMPPPPKVHPTVATNHN